MLNNQISRMRQMVLGVPTAVLAALMGINPNRMSLYMGGTKQLANAELQALDRLLGDLTKLTACAAPFPILFRDVAVIKELLKRMQDGEFDAKLAK